VKRILLLILISLITLTGQVHAEQSIEKTVLEVKEEIALENQKLADIREKNSAGRVVMSQKLETLEQALLPLRQKKEMLKDVLWMKEAGYEQLKDQTGLLKEEIHFAVALLNEYRKDTMVRMSGSEVKHYAGEFAKIDRFLNLDTPEAVLEAVQPVLEFTARKNRQQLGGYIYKGEALDESGYLHKGNIVQAGPIEYFVDDKQKVAGLLGIKLGSSTLAMVYNIAPDIISSLLKGNEKNIPLDFTLGEALKVKKYKKTWFGHIQAGGITMIPILGLGLLCLVTAVWKFRSLMKLEVNADPVICKVLSLLHNKKIAAAKTEAEKVGAPIGTVLLEGIHHHKASQEHIEEIMHEQIMSQIPYLEKNLSILSVAAAAAPLLGLLGTVTGMIHTFDMVAIFGTGKVNLLSGGISEALVTTEFGLVIAIPALLVHAYLARRVKTIVHTLEQTSISFINGLHRKGTGSLSN